MNPFKGTLVVYVPASVQLGTKVAVWSLSQKGLLDSQFEEEVRELELLDNQKVLAAIFELMPGRYRVMRAGYAEATGYFDIEVEAGEQAKIDLSNEKP